jgi:uncharacterized heparinase superfamily protein
MPCRRANAPKCDICAGKSLVSLNRLKWYAARLAAMSPAEVLHRVREAAAKRRFAGNRQGWANVAAVGDAPLPDLGWLRARLAAGLTRAPEQVSASLAALERGEYCGLGQTIRSDDPSLWFRDPVQGGAWPEDAYCFAVDVRSTGAARGDVKFVWEINRLQCLHPAAAAVAAGEAEKDGLIAVLRHWAAANPPYRGVNWFSGIELAMRLVTITFVAAAADWQGEDRLFLRRLVAAHGFWLARYPSKYSSANNHLVAEGLGLLLAGMLAPDLPDAKAWLAEGRHVLETEAALQIFADGVGAEQSPTYQAFTMEMLALAALVADKAASPLAGQVHSRLRKGAEFLRALMDTSGFPPRIGDDDEGRVVAAPPDREPRYVASIVAAVAGLLGEAALLPPGRDAHLRDALFAVPEGAAAAGEGLHVFAEGGYSILRQPMAGRQAVLTFDHGPLGYLSLAAHGHADALALWLSLDDLPVLVDAGTYLYHSGGALRNALRTSQAHNTLTIADASQSVPSSAFSWSRKTNAEALPGEPLAGFHDGYRARFGVRHLRRIEPLADGLVVTDTLEGAEKPLPASIAFLIGPGLETRIEAGRALVIHNGAPLLTIQPQAGATLTLRNNAPETGRGVYSSAFGALEPANQIVIEAMVGAAAFATRITVHPK